VAELARFRAGSQQTANFLAFCFEFLPTLASRESLARWPPESYTWGPIVRASHWLILFRVLCLLSLGTSVALLLDYTSQSPSFCGLDSGCGAVRASGFGYVPLPGTPGIPVPVFGVIGFAAIFSVSFLREASRRKKATQLLSYPAAVVALALLALQAFIGDFCSLCLIVDISALLIGACVWVLSRGGFDDIVSQEESRTTLVDPTELLSEGQRVKDVWKDDSKYYQAPNPLVKPAATDPFRLKVGAWISLCVLSVCVPLGYSSLVATSEVAASIRELYEPGTITVVEFFDYQCPHCRHLSPRLKKLVEGEPKARLVLGYTPLPGHKFARNAARIALCSAEQDKELEVASAFFESENLDPKHLKSLAVGIVGDAEKLDACLQSKRPDERIESDIARIKAAGFEGLPTTYIGERRLLGAQEDSQYLDAIAAVREGSDSSGTNPFTFWGAVLAAILGIFLMGRVPAPERRSVA